MTPIIDVVFLLIIFFMLVCQFIASEQFQVQVPDRINSAQNPESQQNVPLTITVMTDQKDDVIYAIDSEKLSALQGKDLAQLIQSEIDRTFSTRHAVEKTVRLRCDKTVSFGQVKYILSGISKSNATDLDWAVISD